MILITTMKLSWIFALICLCAAQTEVIDGDIDLIYNEIIPDRESPFNSYHPMEVIQYRRTFQAKEDYDLISVEFTISFLAALQPVRHRVFLYIDDELIYNLAGNPSAIWLGPITHMKGYYENLKKGQHKLKIFIATNGDNIYVPRYGGNPAGVTQLHKFSILLITGFKNSKNEVGQNHSMDMIFNEEYKFTNHITTTVVIPVNIPYYQRTFTTNVTYKLVNIELFIPLVGNIATGVWNKFVLYLDEIRKSVPLRIIGIGDFAT